MIIERNNGNAPVMDRKTADNLIAISRWIKYNTEPGAKRLRQKIIQAISDAMKAYGKPKAVMMTIGGCPAAVILSYNTDYEVLTSKIETADLHPIGNGLETLGTKELLALVQMLS